MPFQERKGENKLRSNSEKKVYRSDPIILEKPSPSAVVCFNFWKSLFSGQQLVYRLSQGLVLSLDVTHESKSLLLGVWQHKNWLTVPDRGLFNGVEESLSGDIFSNR